VVVCRDTKAVRKGGRSNPEIVRADDLTSAAEFGPHLSVNACDGLGDRNWLEPGEHVFDECAPVCSMRACRPMHPVQQLTDCDDADGTVLVADERLDCDGGLSALPFDQQARIDQDGQGLSGTAPASRRMRRMSSEKSPSTRGAVARSSRKRSAETSRARGVVMTATGAPARVTSISSP